MQHFFNKMKEILNWRKHLYPQPSKFYISLAMFISDIIPGHAVKLLLKMASMFWTLKGSDFIVSVTSANASQII